MRERELTDEEYKGIRGTPSSYIVSLEYVAFSAIHSLARKEEGRLRLVKPSKEAPGGVGSAILCLEALTSKCVPPSGSSDQKNSN